MSDFDIEQLTKLKRRTRLYHKHIGISFPIIAILIVVVVFWGLKLTGITLAGEAFCGKTEHSHTNDCILTALSCSDSHAHTDSCYDVTYTCNLEEHIHNADCYSNLSADLETAAEWETTLPDLTNTSTAAESLIAIARSQVGYEESKLNYTLDTAGEKHGYTRYGEWYGNPYGEWSNMFTAFCLRYAGLTHLPINSGANAMYLQWKNLQYWQPTDCYTPLSGDLVFLDSNSNGTADATAIITEVNADHIFVIQGDINGQVVELTYQRNDSQILGYGLTQPNSSLIIVDTDMETNIIAKTTTYNPNLFTATNNFLIYTTIDGTTHYAFDGYGNAVPIHISADDSITAVIDDRDLLLWSFTKQSTDTYLIQNIGSGRYMHAYPNNGSGVTTSGAYSSTVISSGNGIKIRSNTEYAKLNVANELFAMTQNSSDAAVFQLGITSRCTVWLDGTNGTLMSLDGSINQSYTVEVGNTIQLPSQWRSPTKYDYTLQGWYDIKNAKYYQPGATVTVTDNMVFYADWIATTYDIGQFNKDVADTVSTNDFITTHVFDYGPLFNVLSSSANVTVNASSHSETWNLLSNGTVPYNGSNSLNFIFRDYDTWGTDISYPNGTNSQNSSGSVYSGLYTDSLGEILFNPSTSFDPATGKGIIGKNYLGQGDHLFQKMNDPDDDNFGYYYYDSSLNAASYNQSDNRFYVYNYLERTTDSAKSSGSGMYSDFLPLNSPYANTNNKTIRTYTYNGINGEYANVNHYLYDAKYNTENNATNYIGTNYWFGISTDINFFLPDAPGTTDTSGHYGNLDLHGKDMHFKFSGDDDVWVLLDGKLVLDIGGVHGIESGDINFSTGIITVNGAQVGTLDGVSEGEHVLTLYYLERGSSQSNCAIYFNLSPRFGLSIQKEDVLSRELLNGAQFSVFTDRECRTPAKLWTSETAYKQGQLATNQFTVTNGSAEIWGLVAGDTYYIRETKAPNIENYSCASGVICLHISNKGVATYSVEILDDIDDNNDTIKPSNGFTVHGFRIDEVTQQAYIVITNAQDWVTETTTVQVLKRWDDTRNHDSDPVTAYLTVCDSDGTIRRIREVVLCSENDWTYTWTNLPKFHADGITPIVYGTEEADFPGYYYQVEKVDQIITTVSSWENTSTFENGKVYILGNENQYLSTTSATNNTLCWVTREVAQTSPQALWTATISSGNVTFKNATGQILSFNNSSTNRYFYATTSNTNYQSMIVTTAGTGIRLSYLRNNRSYYFGSLNTSTGRATATTSSGSAITFTPMTLKTTTTTVEAKDNTFQITNIPLDKATLLTVYKRWETGMFDAEIYQQENITVTLFANGKSIGRTLILNLKNNWTATFDGLRYADDSNIPIVYTVVETPVSDSWKITYGDIVALSGDPPTYEVTITNTYRTGDGYELPATGSIGKEVPIAIGCLLILLSFLSVFFIREKRKSRN